MERSGSPAFGMDRGYGSTCEFRVWIGALHFDSQPYIVMLYEHVAVLHTISRTSANHYDDMAGYDIVLIRITNLQPQQEPRHVT